MGGFMLPVGRKPYPEAQVNSAEEILRAHVERNIRRQLPQVQPFDPQDEPIGLVAGGPSLGEAEEEIGKKYSDGMRLVSVNGTHDWLMERGMQPSAHVMIDSRRFNTRFVKGWRYGTKYFVASQCHPAVFETLRDAEVYIFHAGGSPTVRSIIESYYFGRYFMVHGGSTVVLRGIALLRMLGFTHMEIWGFDSCYLGGEHHAYGQEENEGYRRAKVTVGEKEFECAAWMHSQAYEFWELAKGFGNLLNLIVHGDGLIAHSIRYYAEKRDGGDGLGLLQQR